MEVYLVTQDFVSGFTGLEAVVPVAPIPVTGFGEYKCSNSTEFGVEVV